MIRRNEKMGKEEIEKMGKGLLGLCNCFLHFLLQKNIKKWRGVFFLLLLLLFLFLFLLLHVRLRVFSIVFLFSLFASPSLPFFLIERVSGDDHRQGFKFFFTVMKNDWEWACIVLPTFFFPFPSFLLPSLSPSLTLLLFLPLLYLSLY